MNSKWLPDVFYNWLSVIGALVALMSFNVIVLLLLIDMFVLPSAPSLGILIFLVMPSFLFLGLVCIALGVLIARKKEKQGQHVSLLQSEIYINFKCFHFFCVCGGST